MDKRVSALVLLGFSMLLLMGLGTSLFLLKTLQRRVDEGPALSAMIDQVRGSIREAKVQYLLMGHITTKLLLAPNPEGDFDEAMRLTKQADIAAGAQIAGALKSTRSADLTKILRQLQEHKLASTAALGDQILRLAPQDGSRARDLYLSRYVAAQEHNLALLQQALTLAQSEIDGAQATAREQTAIASRMAMGAIVLFCALAVFAATYLARAVAKLVAASATIAEENRSLIDNSLDVICTVDSLGRFVRVGGACERLWGYTADELRGRAYITMVHPDDIEKTNLVAAEIVAGRSTQSFTNRYIRKDGGIVHTMWSSRWVEEHQQMFAVAHDVTQREQAIEALRDSEERTRLIVATAHDAFAGLDIEGLITEWNPQAERTFGWTRLEAVGQPLHLLIVPVESHEGYLRRLHHFQADREGNFLNRLSVMNMRNREGRQVPVEYNISAIRQGDNVSFGVFMRDITERLRAEKLLKDAKEAAEGASRAKSDFLANMSHEIRTPMNGVLGTVDLLLNTKLSSSQRELASLARASGEILLTIINDVLDFAKIEAGKLVIEPVPFDLLLAIEEVSGIVAMQAEEKNLDLIVRYPADVPRLLIGDPGRISQILINLTSNAIKFTTLGHILLNVEAQTRSADSIVLRFEIQDTGIGIAQDRLEHVFEKFTQADATTTRRFGGTGLGLAICTELVGLMGGQIGATSQLGHGSTFYFTLRLPLQKDVPAMAPPVDLAGTRTLIVDDNAINRRVLNEQIIGWQMRNGSCASGDEALKLLRSAHAAGDPYQIAILDYQMPDMDGVMLGAAIKADPALRDVQLVLVTSLGRRGDAAELKDIGFAAYLVKPTRQSELLATLVSVWAAHVHQRPIDLLTRASLGRERSLPLADHLDQPHVGTRVLLVEDNATNQIVAMMMLRALGCVVDVCGNGQLALDKLDTDCYDIVFMDCEMPVMDGYEATAAIRARGDANARLPIVAVTAQAMQGDRERCLRAGMDAYLTKPVKLTDYAAELRRWVPEGALEQRSIHIESVVLDRGIVDNLRELSSKTDGTLFNQIFVGFHRDSHQRMRLLRDAATAGAWETINSIAHTFKGAAASVGARRLAEVAGALESLGPENSMDDARRLIATLDEEIGLATVEIVALGVAISSSPEATA